MNGSSNVIVLGVTGQVGKLVAKNLKRSEASFSVGTRKRASLAEALTAATGRKFTAEVRNADGFQNHAVQAGSAFESAYAKGGVQLFEQVEDRRMAYVGSVIDDTKKLQGREPLLLTDWAKLHANELLEAAG